MRELLFLLALPFIVSTVHAGTDSAGVSASAVVREMNLARTNPAAYAAHIEAMRASFHGNVRVLSGKTMVRTKEGVLALDDAIRFLNRTRPLAPLALSSGMCQAATDHCTEQADGRMGHGDVAGRMNRYGRWGLIWGENLSYGKSSARAIVLAQIIDDGLPGRKHRKNIFKCKLATAREDY